MGDWWDLWVVKLVSGE